MTGKTCHRGQKPAISIPDGRPRPTRFRDLSTRRTSHHSGSANRTQDFSRHATSARNGRRSRLHNDALLCVLPLPAHLRSHRQPIGISTSRRPASLMPVAGRHDAGLKKSPFFCGEGGHPKMAARERNESSQILDCTLPHGYTAIS